MGPGGAGPEQPFPCRVLEKFYVGELVTREYPWFPKPRWVWSVGVVICAVMYYIVVV